MKHLARAAAVALFLVPVFASAQSNEQIVQQAQALLQQIQALQAQLGAAGGAPIGTAPSGGGSCISGNPIRPGQSGADVTALQQFLAADPAVYPEGKVTGYYGALTQAAVQRFQKKNGIASSGSPSTTGYGSVGPKTASAILALCGGSAGSDPIVGGFMKVSPLSGDAPLQVNVDATVNTVKSCSATPYLIDWGDHSTPISINLPAGRCDTLEQSFSHTYSTGGQYTISLYSGEHKTTSTVTVNGPASQTAGGGSGGQSASGSGSISIGANGFTPAVMTVTSGTKITWTNADDHIHSVTADNNSYNSGALDKGETYSLTFTTKGTYTYYCGLHGSPGSGEIGKIIVQ